MSRGLGFRAVLLKHSLSDREAAALQALTAGPLRRLSGGMYAPPSPLLGAGDVMFTAGTIYALAGRGLCALGAQADRHKIGAMVSITPPGADIARELDGALA